MVWIAYHRVTGALIEAAESQHQLAKLLVKSGADPDQTVLTLAGIEPRPVPVPRSVEP